MFLWISTELTALKHLHPLTNLFKNSDGQSQTASIPISTSQAIARFSCTFDYSSDSDFIGKIIRKVISIPIMIPKWESAHHYWKAMYFRILPHQQETL